MIPSLTYWTLTGVFHLLYDRFVLEKTRQRVENEAFSFPLDCRWDTPPPSLPICCLEHWLLFLQWDRCSWGMGTMRDPAICWQLIRWTVSCIIKPGGYQGINVYIYLSVEVWHYFILPSRENCREFPHLSLSPSLGDHIHYKQVAVD